jgi:hypothetical protein
MKGPFALRWAETLSLSFTTRVKRFKWVYLYAKKKVSDLNDKFKDFAVLFNIPF